MMEYTGGMKTVWRGAPVSFCPESPETLAAPLPTSPTSREQKPQKHWFFSYKHQIKGGLWVSLKIKHHCEASFQRVSGKSHKKWSILRPGKSPDPKAENLFIRMNITVCEWVERPWIWKCNKNDRTFLSGGRRGCQLIGSGSSSSKSQFSFTDTQFLLEWLDLDCLCSSVEFKLLSLDLKKHFWAF